MRLIYLSWFYPAGRFVQRQTLCVLPAMQIDLLWALAMRAVASVGFAALFVGAGVRWPYAHAVALFTVTSAIAACMELRCQRTFRSLQHGAL